MRTVVVTAILALVLGLACGSRASVPQSSTEARSATPIIDDALPPLVDPTEFSDFRPVAEREIRFDEPIDLASAQTWATDSGFETVFVESEGTARDAGYSATTVTLIDDAAGQVSSARVG